ncbi:sugar transporter [Vibrio sp.]|uniref:Sugar transporter n=1 Tax=Vibrio viridaestus TaxID=2487322 RepID=A0A3N9U285_9VIBR|nr:sugar transporter [Vibrio viridaestus]MDC0612519.1 sugar transporter [Vibrio sp.]RQW62036.1 sugar transporter [Vibrio viridaestus]
MAENNIGTEAVNDDASFVNDRGSRTQQYLRVLLLGVSAFVFNTTEFVPVGLLTDIAKDFAVSTAQAGWMLTIYAWIVAGLSLPLMMLTKNMERKKLLIFLFLLFIGSHMLSVFAWSFEILVLSRTGIAVAHAIFWSITASIAIRVGPPGKKTFALGVLATGTSMAMVLGVPVGRMVGQLFGWRATFGLIAAAALVVMISLYRLLPPLPVLFTGTFKKVPELLKTPMLWSLYLITFMAFTSHYTMYSYIEPYLEQVAHVNAHFTTFLLLLFGCAGIIGSVTFGYLGEKLGTALMVTALVLLIITIGIQPWLVGSKVFIAANVVFWGIAMTVLILTCQSKVMSVDANSADIIISMFSGIINLGIGAGALVGGHAISLVTMPHLGYVGSGLAALSLLTLLYFMRKIPELRR